MNDNDLWHLDFKGPLPLLDGQKFWLLVVIDDFSRFCLGIHICSACADAVIAALQKEFSDVCWLYSLNKSNLAWWHFLLT